MPDSTEYDCICSPGVEHDHCPHCSGYDYGADHFYDDRGPSHDDCLECAAKRVPDDDRQSRDNGYVLAWNVNPSYLAAGLGVNYVDRFGLTADDVFAHLD
jgi:hypothetical protein